MIQFPLGFNHFVPWCISSFDRTLNQHSYVWANFLPIWMSDVYGQKGCQESLENEWCYWVIGLLVKWSYYCLIRLANYCGKTANVYFVHDGSS